MQTTFLELHYEQLCARVQAENTAKTNNSTMARSYVSDAIAYLSGFSVYLRDMRDIERT